MRKNQLAGDRSAESQLKEDYISNMRKPNFLHFFYVSRGTPLYLQRSSPCVFYDRISIIVAYGRIRALSVILILLKIQSNSATSPSYKYYIKIQLVEQKDKHCAQPQARQHFYPRISHITNSINATHKLYTKYFKPLTISEQIHKKRQSYSDH